MSGGETARKYDQASVRSLRKIAHLSFELIQIAYPSPVELHTERGRGGLGRARQSGRGRVVAVANDQYPRKVGCEFLQRPEPVAGDGRSEIRDSCSVTAWLERLVMNPPDTVGEFQGQRDQQLGCPFGEPTHLKKSAHGFRVMRKRSAQDHDGDLTVEPCIEGAPDFAHSTRAELRNNYIRAKLRVCGDNYRGASLRFLNPVVQLTITLTGVVLASSTIVTIRNRCPSAVTSYTSLC